MLFLFPKKSVFSSLTYFQLVDFDEFQGDIIIQEIEQLNRFGSTKSGLTNLKQISKQRNIF